MEMDKAKAYDIEVVHTGTKSRMHGAAAQPPAAAETNGAFAQELRDALAALESDLDTLKLAVAKLGQ